jgi:nascent polypeptide-associated complex subunit alpha
MIPGLGGMNPKKMAGMMKQLGINQTEIEAVRVVIEKVDGGKLVVEPASVQKISMQGQESFQVAGEVRESEAVEEGISEDDVKLVMEKTGKGEEEVRRVLEEVGGEVAEAIVKLG